MKRIVIVILLVAIAGVAGVVRSSVGSVAELRGLVSHKNAADVRQEIRQTYFHDVQAAMREVVDFLSQASGKVFEKMAVRM